MNLCLSQACDREDRPVGVRGLRVREPAAHVAGRLRVTQRPLRSTPQQPAPAPRTPLPSAPPPAAPAAQPRQLRRRLPPGRHASQQVYPAEYLLPSSELETVILIDVLCDPGGSFAARDEPVARRLACKGGRTSLITISIKS